MPFLSLSPRTVVLRGLLVLATLGGASAVAAGLWPFALPAWALLVVSALVAVGALNLSLSRKTAPGTPDQGDTLLDPSDPLFISTMAAVEVAAQALKMDVLPLQVVVEGPYAWAGAAQVTASFGTDSGTVVRVSLALAMLFADRPRYMAAVIAHELGHLRRHEVRRHILALVGSAVAGATLLLSVVSLLAVSGAWGAVLLVSLTAAALPNVVNAVRSYVGYTGELGADRVGASAFSADTMARALLTTKAQGLLANVDAATRDQFLAARPLGLEAWGAWRDANLYIAIEPLSLIYTAARAETPALVRFIGQFRDPHPSTAFRCAALGVNPRSAARDL